MEKKPVRRQVKSFLKTLIPGFHASNIFFLFYGPLSLVLSGLLTQIEQRNQIVSTFDEFGMNFLSISFLSILPGIFFLPLLVRDAAKKYQVTHRSTIFFNGLLAYLLTAIYDVLFAIFIIFIIGNIFA